MSITLFSVLTTVICSGILTAVLCILKRLRVFRGKSYINVSILLYIAALLRLLLPFEFFFTRSCGFPAVCNPLREVMIYPVYGDSINIEGFFSFVWFFSVRFCFFAISIITKECGIMFMAWRCRKARKTELFFGRLQLPMEQDPSFAFGGVLRSLSLFALASFTPISFCRKLTTVKKSFAAS